MGSEEKSVRPTLGVVAISRNESANLPGFLSNLLPWVDEIIIVDDGSTDDTGRIASEAGPKVRFVESPREGGEGFDDQRNKGIALASSDWLLHLDIDERVTPELADEILGAIGDGGKDAYRYRRLNFWMNRPMRGGGFQKWNGAHLARRQKLRFENKIHERAVIDAPETRIGQLENKIWHLNDVDYAHRLRKNIEYSRFEADKIVASGKRVSWMHFILGPLRKSLSMYFLHGGYRDGVLGVLWGLYAFASVLTWYAMAWERQNKVSRVDLESRLARMWSEKGKG